jgi:hypothetical protein
MADPTAGNEAALNEPDESSLNSGLGDDDQVEQSPVDQALQFEKTYRGLQNDDIFQAPIVPGEVPDLKDDVKLIASDENALEDLQFLMADMKRVGGMCQAFALEAERVAPGVMGVPAGYFTKAPTSTRYKIATENLFAKVWEFIKQAIQKLRDGLKKIIYWLIGKKDDKGDPEALKRENAEATKKADDVAKEGEKATDDVAAAAINVSNAVKHGVEFKENGGTQQYSSMDRIIGEALGGQNDHVRKFMAGQDSIFSDLVNQGSYFKFLMETNKVVMPAATALQTKIGESANLIKTLIASEGQTASVVQGDTLRKLAEPISFKVGAQSMNLSQYLEHLRTQQSEAEKTQQQMREFDEVFTALSQAFRQRLVYELNRFVEAGTSTLIDAEEVLREVEEQLTKASAQEHTAESNVDWHKTIHALRTDITDLSAILMHVKTYRTQVTVMLVDLMEFAYDVAEAIMKRLTGESNHQVTETVQMLAKEAKHYRDNLAKMGRI